VDGCGKRKQENKLNSFALLGLILMYLLCPKKPPIPHPIEIGLM
jgi:hypothetical protein